MGQNSQRYEGSVKVSPSPRNPCVWQENGELTALNGSMKLPFRGDLKKPKPLFGSRGRQNMGSLAFVPCIVLSIIMQGTNARLPIFCRSREPKRGFGFFTANLLEKGSFDTAVQGCEFAILLATHMDFAIHAENESKTRHVMSLPGARERLTPFKADVTKEGTFDSALSDCDFVVHLATPMDFTIDAEAQTTVVEAEVKGTLDILKACAKAKSVRRLIYTSSINAASPLNNHGKFGDCVDESCWTPVDLIRREKALFWMYYVAKTLSEQAALQYASDHSIEVVTLAPALVAGPSLTPTLPASIEETLGLITGSQECYEWLKEFQWLMGSIALVHTDDLCDAYIFLMEHQSAKGRYICSAQDLSLMELWDFCNKRYSQFCPPLQYPKEDDFLNHVPVSSKRLLDLDNSMGKESI